MRLVFLSLKLWMMQVMHPVLSLANSYDTHGLLFCLSLQSPGGSASEIFAKLEVYMWLGLGKYSKEATSCLPEEFLPVFEEEEEQRRLVSTGNIKLPASLSCQGESANLVQEGAWSLYTKTLFL